MKIIWTYGINGEVTLGPGISGRRRIGGGGEERPFLAVVDKKREVRTRVGGT